MHSHYGLEIEAMHSLYTAVGRTSGVCVVENIPTAQALDGALESTFVLLSYT